MGREDRPLIARLAGLLILLLAPAACGPRAAEHRTVSILDLGHRMDPAFDRWRAAALEAFTRQTGIVVEVVPSPESANLQLVSCQKLLAAHSDTPDVYGIDVIWPVLLADHLLDLRPLLGREAALAFPAMVANDTVQGRLVALPYHANGGVLLYRTDLLRQYGFAAPPETWADLEHMAALIQAGERAKGRKGFWGFVWQGALDEALTCNALEWQASEGGGRIVEDDRTISVNNPDAVRSWRRAAAWIGSISPKEVVASIEEDSERIWRAGDAAFMRNWPAASGAGESEASAVKGRFAVSALPRGAAGHASALGGYGLAISRYSSHRQDAVALVRYLCSPETQRWRSRQTSIPPTIPDLYADPEAIRLNPFFAPLKEVFGGGAVARPSSVTGSKYVEVSEAYCRAVHSTLTGKMDAARAAADLEEQLAGMGFRRPTRPRATTR